MADHIHNSLAAFRDTMLTAIARLEFQIRDSIASSRDLHESSTILSDIYAPNVNKNDAGLQEVFKRLDALEHSLIAGSRKTQMFESEFMDIRPPANTRNVLVPSVRSTPALTAAVAAASIMPPDLDLQSEASSDTEGDSASEKEVPVVVPKAIHANAVKAKETEESTENVEAVEEEEKKDVMPELESESEGEEEKEKDEEQDDEEEQEDEEPELVPIKIKKVQYYIDPENNLYKETEEGYEQVGIYDRETKTIKPLEEEIEEEEVVELEDFVFKGKTYQKDAENNCYLDGCHMGIWNGKKIVPQ